MSIKLEELREELKEFASIERAELTDEELKTLRTMFAVPGSFNALFRYLVTIESEKGTQLAYEIEGVHTVIDGATADEVDREIELKKTITRYLRGKLEGIRGTFKKDIQEEIEKEEAVVTDIKDKADKENGDVEQEKIGLGHNV